MNKECTLLEACQEDPSLLFGYKKLKADLLEYQLDQHNALPDLTDFEFVTPQGEVWHRYLKPKTEKKKHYWFWSTMPDKGKTHFLKCLDEVARCSWYNTSELYQDINPTSQFILIDEYSEPTLKVTQVNKMCDGTYQYPNKGGIAKRPEPYIMICGNKDPKIMYPNTIQFLEARFEII